MTPPRLKILMSAYACEPRKGSEPEVGWQWSLQMAYFHDVTVLTRANNRISIEAELSVLKGKQPLPQFVYHDESPLLLKLKRRMHATKTYYLLWQRSARKIAARLHAEHRFDLFHHVTFAAMRYPTIIWGHGAPSVWGPIGGAESVPFALLPWSQPAPLLVEASRNVHNFLHTRFFRALSRRASASTVTLVTSRETQRAFAALGFETPLMPAIGLDTDAWKAPAHSENSGPLKLLFVGNIITLKGVDLAIKALKESGSSAMFTLVGDGSFLPAIRRLTRHLGLESQVHFQGRLPRAEVLALYPEFDVFVFPSLHDTGGYAVIEAMLNELPVICLDCGGPAVATHDDCGIKIPLGPPAKVISGLAAAIRNYDQNRDLVQHQGRQAREVILKNYNWKRKGEQMNEVYQQAVSVRRTAGRPS